MRRIIPLLVTAAFSLLPAAPAHAQITHVPTNYATIQAAINSGATTVYVADGTYPETLDVQRTVTLLPEPAANPKNPSAYPHVSGLKIHHNGVDEATVYVRGFRFTGVVTHTNAMAHEGNTLIEGCRLDGGFWTFGGSGGMTSIRIRSCVITGNVFLYAYHNEFTGNTLWKGSADIHSNGGNGALVRDNLVIGPSTTGLTSTSPDTPGLISDNTIVGVTTGASIVSGTIRDNTIQDCTTGLTNAGTYGSGRTFLGNRIRRGSTGIDLPLTSGYNVVTSNDIDSVSAAGIHAASGAFADISDNSVNVTGTYGIWNESSGPVSGNRVLRAGRDGIRSSEMADWNVVGRSVGHGIVAPEARHNTVYLNGGAGLSLNGTAADTISNNIAYGNTGVGLRWSGLGTPVLRCNDWYSNIAGATSGVTPGGTDMSVNPQFCNLPRDLVGLTSGSMLVSPFHCGLVGALGVSCTAVTDAPGTSAPALRFSVRPNPAGAHVELSWSGSLMPSRIEVFDVAGAVRFSTEVPAGASTFVWRGDDDAHRRLPRGVYFVRHSTPQAQELARVVLR